MLQKKYISFFLLLLMAATASAQKAERDFIRKGNRFFKDSVYVDAEVNYRKALETNPQSTVSMFNLGNTLAQQNKLQEAMEHADHTTELHLCLPFLPGKGKYSASRYKPLSMIGYISHFGSHGKP